MLQLNFQSSLKIRRMYSPQRWLIFGLAFHFIGSGLSFAQESTEKTIEDFHQKMDQKMKSNLDEISQFEAEKQDFIRRKKEIMSKMKGLKEQEAAATSKFQEVSTQGDADIKSAAIELAKLQRERLKPKSSVSDSEIKAAQEKFNQVKARANQVIEDAREERVKIQQKQGILRVEAERLVREKKADIILGIDKSEHLKAQNDRLEKNKGNVRKVAEAFRKLLEDSEVELGTTKKQTDQAPVATAASEKKATSTSTTEVAPAPVIAKARSRAASIAIQTDPDPSDDSSSSSPKLEVPVRPLESEARPPLSAEGKAKSAKNLEKFNKMFPPQGGAADSRRASASNDQGEEKKSEHLAVPVRPVETEGRPSVGGSDEGRRSSVSSSASRESVGSNVSAERAAKTQEIKSWTTTEIKDQAGGTLDDRIKRLRLREIKKYWGLSEEQKKEFLEAYPGEEAQKFLNVAEKHKPGTAATESRRTSVASSVSKKAADSPGTPDARNSVASAKVTEKSPTKETAEERKARAERNLKLFNEKFPPGAGSQTAQRRESVAEIRTEQLPSRRESKAESAREGTSTASSSGQSTPRRGSQVEGSRESVYEDAKSGQSTPRRGSVAASQKEPQSRKASLDSTRENFDIFYPPDPNKRGSLTNVGSDPSKADLEREAEEKAAARKLPYSLDRGKKAVDAGLIDPVDDKSLQALADRRKSAGAKEKVFNEKFPADPALRQGRRSSLPDLRSVPSKAEQKEEAEYQQRAKAIQNRGFTVDVSPSGAAEVHGGGGKHEKIEDQKPSEAKAILRVSMENEPQAKKKREEIMKWADQYSLEAVASLPGAFPNPEKKREAPAKLVKLVERLQDSETIPPKKVYGDLQLARVYHEFDEYQKKLPAADLRELEGALEKFSKEYKLAWPPPSAHLTGQEGASDAAVSGRKDSLSGPANTGDAGGEIATPSRSRSGSSAGVGK